MVPVLALMELFFIVQKQHIMDPMGYYPFVFHGKVKVTRVWNNTMAIPLNVKLEAFISVVTENDAISTSENIYT